MHAVIEKCESVHASRKLGIGASLAAAVTGLSRHKTKHAALADLLGLTPETTSRPMRIGKAAEGLIRTEYEIETGDKVNVSGDGLIYRHPKFPWLICHPDGLIEGKAKGVEFKVAGQHSWKEWGEPEHTQVPQEYYIQCLHSMIVTGLREWDLVVLIGTDIKVYPIEWEESQAQALFKSERSFWQKYVIERQPLPVDGSEDCRNLMSWMNPKNTKPLDWATGETAKLLNLFATVKRNRDAEEANYDELANRVREAIGDRDGLKTDQIQVTWKTNKKGVRVLLPKLVDEEILEVAG